jgi:hypothetical protein
MSSVWKGNKTGKKKTRPAYKPKIRWELLGLSDPDVSPAEESMDAIRKEVSTLASRGFGPGTLVRSAETGNGRGGNRPSTSSTKRRGTTQ